ncbi:PucR family transcriptional regulator ligand-binding domain-containing protein [Arthrobacter sp. zg-Y20]|uniref:PucR family transcriptional regulator n=1 Tax=unclassified Arthrobacter TaxID=235627 RepID=UPI001D155003|nr:MULTISPECIES: PucR family transcriptional regulator [unclassified Arthrobacter]MCC3275978.1 PucR family transcriptional regulator ligand-binding domain-containing protein [Arthrobacter sp. zg-Y20]MDK1316135.1 PucR family transcriptional regulator ligand-binding domain-containing protein [Arthrobacter sp. zg.Y20]WIB05580.1 PucR family transcriptional regulator ligand-binding domain-containing protein [Arthrobacter sp. zg-Y20]
MSITLPDLLAAGGLNLTRHGSAPLSDRPIQWVAVTELEDPSPFLGGGEVVLTTGLRHSSAAAQRRFVQSVDKAGALGIGFGTGLSHGTVPGPLLAEADRRDLPVFEVPYDTPFMALGKLVADSLSAEHVTHLHQLLSAHQVLAEALLSGKGLPRLLTELSRLVGAEVALFQYGAPVFATAQPDSSWRRIPVSTGMRDRCTLAIAEPFVQPDVVAYASSLIGVELSNQAARRASSRKVTGQLLGDVVDGRLAGADAAVRLRSAGIDTSQRLLILLLEAASGQVRGLPALPLPAAFDGAPTGVYGKRLAVVVPASDGPSLAEALSSFLFGAGLTAKVGVGGAYTEPGGLRWSYYEAREALQRGAAVNEPERLSLTSLLMAGRDVPLADLAAEALGPLEAFDNRHGAQLLPTLDTYLALNGSVAAVAADLNLHRNTVRYRLAQIAELTGYDPAVTADRVHLFLALSVRRLGG